MLSPNDDGSVERKTQDRLPNEARWDGDDQLSELRRLPNLDGLRGIALLGPLVNHACSIQPFNYFMGSMGVTIFFTLSGFLITNVLIRHQQPREEKCSFSHLPRFWCDRFVRLQPALLLCIAVNLVLALTLYGRENLNAFAVAATRAALNLMNTPVFATGNWHTDEGGFGHAWSLACEVQLYLFLSVFLALFAIQTKEANGLGRKQTRIFDPRIILVLLCVISILVCLFDGRRSLQSWLLDKGRGPLAQLWKVLAGSLLRLYGFPKRQTHSLVGWVGMLSLPVLSLCAANLRHDHGHTRTLILDLSATVATAMIISGSAFDNNPILASSALRFLGRISYAAYLWPAMLIWTFQLFRSGIWALCATTVGLLCATISTLYVEEPLRLAYKNFRCRTDSKSYGLPVTLHLPNSGQMYPITPLP